MKSQKVKVPFSGTKWRKLLVCPRSSLENRRLRVIVTPDPGAQRGKLWKIVLQCFRLRSSVERPAGHLTAAVVVSYNFIIRLAAARPRTRPWTAKTNQPKQCRAYLRRRECSLYWSRFLFSARKYVLPTTRSPFCLQPTFSASSSGPHLLYPPLASFNKD